MDRYTENMIRLGLDIGTTTISAVAFDAGRETLLASVTLPTDADATPPAQRANGWAEIDVPGVYQHALEALRGVVAQLGALASEIGAIGMTGQMHGVAFLDENSMPARTAITWQDQRGKESLPAFIARAGGAGAFAEMGALPAAGYGAVTLHWLREQDILPSALPCSIPDAIGAMLCHTAPKIDPTNAAGWGVFNVAKGTWDEAVLARLDLAVQWPQIVSAGTPVGRLTRAAAQACNLQPDIPVAVAVGDHPASLIGSGCTRAGTAHVNIGTGSQVSLVSDRFTPMDRRAGVETRPFVDGQFVLTGASLCGGSAFALLRCFYETAAAMMGLPAPNEADLYSAMLASAIVTPAGAEGLIADTRFDGARHDPLRRASLHGMTRSNFTPAHLNRAVLEGIAEELAQFYEAMVQSQGRAAVLVGSGNGLRKNSLLQEIVSRRFELPLRLPAWQEEAAIGAAMIAGG